MKRRIPALFLSGIMMFSGAGTAYAMESVELPVGETEELILEENLTLEGDLEEVTEIATDDEAVFEEIENTEDFEATESEQDREFSEEDTAYYEDDTVFATGLSLEGTDYEIVRGEAYDEAAFQGMYPASYINENLPELRDQNPYGTCWAFATTALTEINLMQNGAYRNPDLSELHLAYFNSNTVVDPLGLTKGDYYSSGSSYFLNSGGNFENAFSTLQKWTGLASESKVPYSSASKVVKSGLSNNLAYDDQAHIESSFITTIDLDEFRSTGDLTLLDPAKKMITEYGAAGIYFGAIDSMSGATSAKVYSSKYKSYYNSSPIAYNHAVVVVGWDDNFSRENFAKKAPGDGAFLVRNSWTTGNVNSHFGYFWMSYYEASLFDNFYAIKATSADNYDNNYQYDGFFANSYQMAENGANVFTAKASSKGEVLKAVAFYSLAEATSYKIEIYTDVKNPPDSGTLVPAATTTGTCEFAGYYTVPLAEEVQLHAGTKFAVAVTLGVPALMYDASVYGSSLRVSAGEGETYYYSYGKWYSHDSNVRIKAYTDNSDDVVEPDPEEKEYEDPEDENTEDEIGSEETDTEVEADKLSLEDATVTSRTVVPVAKGKKKLSSIKVEVAYGDVKLKKDVDYELIYEGDKGVVDPAKVVLNDPYSDYTIRVVAKEGSEYTGEVPQKITVDVVESKYIVKASKLSAGDVNGKTLKFYYGDLSSETDIAQLFSDGVANVYYQKKALDYGYDYLIEAIDSDYSTVGTHKLRIVGLSGNRYYEGTKVVSFKVLPYNIKNDTAGRLNIQVEDAEYSKKGARPEPVVTFIGPDGEEQILEKGVDYTISYKNNKKVFEASEDNKKSPTVVIKGKGRFTGSAKKYFSIYPVE